MRRCFVLAVLALPACSGGDDSDADATTTTAVAAADTTAAASTTTPARETSSTTSTTLDPSLPDRIQETYLLSWERLDDALLDPADDVNIELALSLLAEPRRDVVRDALLEARAESVFERTRDGQPAGTEIVDGSLVYDARTATLVACEVDSNLVYRLDEAGTEVLVSDAIDSSLVEVSLIERNDAWLVEAVTQQRVFSGRDDCDG